jgi:hypothetical protein
VEVRKESVESFMATIRTHTTLRTLFVKTAVFALLAAMWSAAPRDEFLHGALTSCAIAFVAGLFGFSFWATFFIALATAFAFDAFFLGSFRWRDAPSAWVMRQALDNVPSVALFSVTPWLTA